MSGSRDSTIIDTLPEPGLNLRDITGVASAYTKNLENHLRTKLYQESFDVAIIGGGIGGCLAALELAQFRKQSGEPFYNVTILEKNDELLRGTAQKTPGRLGLGFHYLDEATAFMYLERTTDFMRRFSNARRVDHLPLNHNLRRGRYVVMESKDENLPKPMEVLNAYVKIAKKYQEMVKQDPENKIWGEPENFLKILYVAKDNEVLKHPDILNFMSNSSETKQKRKALMKEIEMNNVALVIETAEELLDWNKCRDAILTELNSYKNIKVELGANVQEMHYDDHENDIVIRYTNSEGLGQQLVTDYPVVCAWDKSEQLAQTLGVKPSPNEITTNRLKSIIEIELPEDMWDTPSMFFCMGPYAMFSNLGKGRGRVTYAPATNMGGITADQPLPEVMESFLQGKAPALQVRKKGDEILQGASRFIPGLKNAKVIKVDFGIVRTRGSAEEIDINLPQGKIGERDYGWVRVYDIPGSDGRRKIILSDAMKITFSGYNAGWIRNLIANDIYNMLLNQPQTIATLLSQSATQSSNVRILSNFNRQLLDIVNKAPEAKVETSPHLRSSGGMPLRSTFEMLPPVQTPTAFSKDVPRHYWSVDSEAKIEIPAISRTLSDTLHNKDRKSPGKRSPERKSPRKTSPKTPSNGRSVGRSLLNNSGGLQRSLGHSFNFFTLQQAVSLPSKDTSALNDEVKSSKRKDNNYSAISLTQPELELSENSILSEGEVSSQDSDRGTPLSSQSNSPESKNKRRKTSRDDSPALLPEFEGDLQLSEASTASLSSSSDNHEMTYDDHFIPAVAPFRFS